MKRKIEELLQLPYWVIDILPEQVPEDSNGQFFAVEEYFLEKKQLATIKQKHINLILKLNCYQQIFLNEEKVVNPSPEHIAEEVKNRYLYIFVNDSMILSKPDDTYMTIFNPDENLLSLIKTIALGEGLFVWKPTT